MPPSRNPRTAQRLHRFPPRSVPRARRRRWAPPAPPTWPARPASMSGNAPRVVGTAGGRRVPRCPTMLPLPPIRVRYLVAGGMTPPSSSHPESLSYVAPFAPMLVGVANAVDDVVAAYRTGGGVPYSTATAPTSVTGRAPSNRPDLSPRDGRVDREHAPDRCLPNVSPRRPASSILAAARVGPPSPWPPCLSRSRGDRRRQRHGVDRRRHRQRGAPPAVEVRFATADAVGGTTCRAGPRPWCASSKRSTTWPGRSTFWAAANTSAPVWRIAVGRRAGRQTAFSAPADEVKLDHVTGGACSTACRHHGPSRRRPRRAPFCERPRGRAARVGGGVLDGRRPRNRERLLQAVPRRGQATSTTGATNCEL